MPTSTQTQSADQPAVRTSDVFIYLAMGIFFGVVLILSEVVSWFRIQEMFRFQSFHMYGIIGSAVAVAAVSLQILKRTNATTIRGEPITIKDKPWNKGANQLIGGTFFGLGWGLLGACPGPIYALIGAGITPVIVGLLAALLGALTYGYLKPNLPH
ncbi:DUF6691 family protein [Longibacter sp.]|jgi:uncharacterized membrane protein YedE/YeeE|uniref:DUF6691 family protein n=1 Tax=Longibacter sp. TaxID=2045415 RepID=UPI003EB6AAC7